MMKHKVNHERIKILKKNGYTTVDVVSQKIICPDGKTKSIPQWDIDYYLNLHKHQKLRRLV